MENSPADSVPPDPASARRVFSWRKKFLLLLALATSFYAVAEWPTGGPRAPRYGGKSLSAWVYERAHKTNGWFIPEEEYSGLGSDHIAWLAWAAEHGRIPKGSDPRGGPPSGTAEAIRAFWRKLFHGGFVESYDERVAALVTLSMVGRNAAPAIPALTRILADPNRDYVEKSMNALVAIGPAAWPAIEHSFDGGQEPLRDLLIESIGLEICRGKPSPTEEEMRWYVRFLIRASADSEKVVRYNAAFYLVDGYTYGTTSSFADIIVPVFVTLISDPDTDVRYKAFEGLKVYGVNSPAIISRLLHLLDDPDASIRQVAAWTLKKTDPKGQRSKARLQQLMNDPDEPVRNAAEEILKEFDKPADQ